MKKRLLTVILLAAVLFLFAAHGSASGDIQAERSPGKSKLPGMPKQTGYEDIGILRIKYASRL